MATRNRYPTLQQIGWLILIALTGFVTPASAQEPPVQPAATIDPRFGLVNSFENTNAATNAGAGWTRIFLRWDVVQPGGPSDWKPTNVPDTFLEAELSAGREVVAVLIGTPAWATDSHTSTAVPPLEFWGDFVFKIATQYKGRINHWVIWNQPDISDPDSPNYTWDGTVEDYYRLLKEAYLKIKAVDPQMQVHIAGLTYTWDQDRGNRQYLDRLLEVITADPQAANQNYFFDAAGYHLYHNPRHILDALADVQSILAAYGLGHKPVWLTETHAPPVWDMLESQATPAAGTITLQEQSAFVIQAFALALAGGAERVAFTPLRDRPESTETYGLLRADNSPRPAFNAFKTVTRHFAGVQQFTWQQTDGIYLVTLDRGGQTTTVLWTTAQTPARIALNAIAPQALLVDDEGREQTITPAEGRYSLELPAALCSTPANCAIGGAPRLIVETGSPAARANPPLVLPAAAATPAATNTPLPTATLPPEPPPTPLPTLTPTPAPPAAEPAATLLPPTPAPGSSSSLPAALPAPGLAPSGEEPASPAAVTPVPPVNLASVLKPRRIMWLLVIGLVVFMVSYGVQVAIWYRLRR